ncbi:MAG: ATPase [Solirubrobacterales bacterium]|nr:ATPase [Solirubrobacterales bacterium]
MTEAPLPPDEAARLESVRALAVLDTPQEERFDRLTRIAADLFRVPICTITLIDANRQWFKSCIGLDSRETPRAFSFCAHAVLQDETLVIPDAQEDERFADNPLVTGEPRIRFYAGHPLYSPEGFKLGTLCLIDRVPRTMEATEIVRLRELAQVAENELNSLELSHALRRLSDSEQRLHAVMDGVAEGIVTFAADGRVLSANPAALATFRADPGDLLGRGVDRLVQGMNLDEIRARVGAVEPGAETEPRARTLVTGRRSDGTLFPLELAISQANVAGEALFIGIGMDVTVAREAERALRQSEWRFRAIFDSAAIGIGLMRLDGPIVDANAALAQMLRRPVQELRAMELRELIAAHHDPDARPDGEAADEGDELIAALRGRRAHQFRRDLPITRGDGTTMWGSLTVSVLQEEEEAEAPRFAIALLEDITSRREAERVKDEFVSVVSHELRTPLTSIRGSLGLVTGGVMGELPPEVQAMLDVAEQNAERLVRLVNDILDIERLGSGRVDLELADVAARGLLEQAVDTVEAMAAAGAVTIRIHAPQEVDVRADGLRVVQALTNLLGNAIKFSPPESEIVVSVAVSDGAARFTVADNGRGIPDELLDGIFERFRQVDASDSREKGGTGLGLAIARTIVEQHRGRIWAESSPGGGATFRFTLPLHAPGVGVLVIEGEDESDGVGRIVEQVRALGHRPLLAHTAAEAIALIAQERPGAILLPLGDRCAEIRAELALDASTREIPVVLVGPSLATDELLEELRTAIPLLRPGAVLIVEDDPSLGPILCRALSARGIPARLARDGAEAVQAVRDAPPGLVVLDLVLPDADGFAIVDLLRGDGLLRDTPLLVYSALDLDAGARRRLQDGQTEFLGKADATPQDVERRVSQLLGRVVGGPPA